ncbi:MAG TPA: methyltransferase domain-containing protein [Anaerolineae bacterium]|nr:methyltransferase domain-containing protein [Anaerolineae bacterium]HQH36956.1 methyltransferase domain-containing protein [Anaerolineae bacterium]
MKDTHVNYDALAPTYNRRFEEDKDRPATARTLLELAGNLNVQRVLEVGCGTGRWLAELHTFTKHCYGLDPSKGMLAQAYGRNLRLRLARGRGERLPFSDAMFDLVYCVNAIHHMDGQQTFIQEARRVLRDGGALAVIGMTPREQRHTWYIYEYFEGVYETDLARFPSWETVIDWMRAAGFQNVERRPVERIIDHKTNVSVLNDPFLQRHASSQLALLSDAEYATGVQRIKIAVAEAEAAGETLIFPTELIMEMVWGC